MRDFLSLDLSRLKGALAELKEPEFRAVQLFEWVYKRGVSDFSAMSNLPKTLRERLGREFYFSPLKLLEREADKEGTEKFLWELDGGETIESVGLRHPNHLTLCLSTQVGCALACAFCATGAGGFVRNLTSGEIVAQVVHMERELGEGADNIVFMGMGEPLLNEENLYRAIETLHSPHGRNLGIRRFTVSTAGLPEAIERLADSGKDLKLSLSLHSAIDEVRSSLMPLNTRYPLARLREALEYYQRRTKNRITFEYALVEGLNDSREAAEKLIGYLSGLKAFVNVIPVNPVEQKYIKPSRERIEEFMKVLTRAGIETARRYERGTDIAAACGQLRRRKGGDLCKEERG